MQVNMSAEVKRVFDKYPDCVRAKMFRLRELVLETAREPLKHCIKAALTYHQVKHLPTLGI